MEGFALILGHLIGDYIVQNDWMALNKTNEKPKGDRPCTRWDDGIGMGGVTPGSEQDRDEWGAKYRRYLVGHLACAVHCVLYTLAVAVCCFWFLPWWSYLVILALHFPVDRWRLARRWMVSVSGQEKFATGPLSPWSIIVVDNIFHLAVLFAVAMVAR
jgi:hypothetical protein